MGKHLEGCDIYIHSITYYSEGSYCLLCVGCIRGKPEYDSRSKKSQPKKELENGGKTLIQSAYFEDSKYNLPSVLFDKITGGNKLHKLRAI